VIAVIADERGLASRFVAEKVHQLHTRHVVSARFDDGTDTWLLRTDSGDEICSQAVVDTRRFHVPSTPNWHGRNEFNGPSFHSLDWDPTFDPARKRIAVIGDRAAHVVSLLADSEVKLFDCPPHWETRKAKRRWRPHARGQNARPVIVTSAIERITPTGIRTADGMDHDVDAIIYATRSATKNGIADDALVGLLGLTIQRAWQDGAEAYLGVAVHGFPNYFMLLGPDSPVGNREAVIDRQVRYIAGCLKRMKHKGSTRVEVRRSAQRQFTQRARIKPPAAAFDVSGADVQPEIYDGPATLTVSGSDHAVRVRLTGHLDPIDGKYHWQGTVFGATSELPAGSRPVILATDALTTQARITEQTPWGSYSITGVGTPPFELNQPT
jgi:Domain of unknown function (DUF4873)